jgi:type IX secretion system PorP/SprF family membrane protein
MRTILRTVFFTLIVSNVQAQFIPNSALPFQFASAYNPAFAGVDNFADLKLSYRYQWSSLGPDAPRFINLAYNVRLKQPLDLSNNSLRTSNALGLNSDEVPKSKRIIHGFAAQFFNENVGQVERLGGGVSYSFNYPIAKKVRMAIGVSAVVDNTKVDLNGVELRDADPFYDQLVANGTPQTNLNIRGGILFYSSKFYLGVSYFPIVNSALQESDLSTNQIFYKASFQGGIALPASANLVFRPSVLGLLQVDNKMAFDYSIKTYIHDKVWFGFTYRDIKSGIALIGLNINESISLAYAFETALSDYSKFGGTSHDIVVSVRFNNFRHRSQYMW